MGFPKGWHIALGRLSQIGPSHKKFAFLGANSDFFLPSAVPLFLHPKGCRTFLEGSRKRVPAAKDSQKLEFFGVICRKIPFFRAAFGCANKNFKWLLVVLGGRQQEEGAISAFLRKEIELLAISQRFGFLGHLIWFEGLYYRMKKTRKRVEQSKHLRKTKRTIIRGNKKEIKRNI